MKIFEYETIDSTFVESGRMAPGLDEGQYLFLAECQTAGRGQGDHRFESPDGNGIYATLLLKYPKIHKSRLRLLTPMSAVCITGQIKKHTGFGSRLTVRYVNDLMLDGKKYGGILSGTCVDGDMVNYIRIGFGINTGNCDVSGKVGIPTESIHIEDGNVRRKLALDCAESITEATLWWDEEKIFIEYSEICRMENVGIILPDGRICRCGKIDPDFSLNVIASDGSVLKLNGTSGLRFI